MEDFANLLHRDYGIKPQGKMAPMSAAKATAAATSGDPAMKGKSSSSTGSNARSARTSTPSFGDDDIFFGTGTRPRNASSASEPLGGSYDDVFGGPPKFAPPKHSSTSSAPAYDDIFRSQPPPPPPPPSSSRDRDQSLPVFDTPSEDDIFVGVRGTRSSGVSYDNVFGGAGAGASSSGNPMDDLLGGYKSGSKTKVSPPPQFDTGSSPYDDDLIPGMGSGYSSSKQQQQQQPEPQSFISVEDPVAPTTEVDPFGDIQPDPFSGIPAVSDPLDDPFTGYSKSTGQTYNSPPRKVDAEGDSDDDSLGEKEEVVQTMARDYVPGKDYIPEKTYSGDLADGPTSDGLKEAWVTVDSVRLLTEPTGAPPPSRPPPGPGYQKRAYANGVHDFKGSDDEDEAEASFKREREREFQRAQERKEEERLQREREVKERVRREREAVERATQEARQRAAKQARDRAERIAVEKATAEARERAAAEARQKAERAAAERAAAEKDREAADKAAAEKAAAQTRARERAAVDRINAQVRERAAEEARRAAAAQQKTKEKRASADDLDGGFFGRATSAPKQRPPTSDFAKAFASGESERRGSSGAPVKKVPSASGIDELTNLFDSPSSPFREIDGETPDRRRARLERDQRTQARARQALEEKHRRDLAAQREQAEKQRASDALDSEIKRWAAGKEGNLRALLSTLQYVLWPECGWQPVSLTDLLTGAAVKKVYRRATLCVHPDKVQQKGATIQQKYIAEKVFDMLKEAWNKFNSEELF